MLCSHSEIDSHQMGKVMAREQPNVDLDTSPKETTKPPPPLENSPVAKSSPVKDSPAEEGQGQQLSPQGSQEEEEEGKHSSEGEPEEPPEDDMITFESLGLLSRTAKQALKLHGMQTPTTVQTGLLRALPSEDSILVLGRGQAGKTMAGIMATLKTIDLDLDKVQVVYVVYSKGMAGRVTGILNDIAPDRTLKVYRSVSGLDVQRDIYTLFRSVNHVIVGTPGRLLDLVDRRATDFSCVKLVVVDQADLIMNLTRRKRLACELVRTLGDHAAVVALSRSLHPGIQMFRRVFLGGDMCFHVTDRDRGGPPSRPRRVNGRAAPTPDDSANGRSRSAGRMPPANRKPWKYAIVCGEHEDDVPDELLQRFFMAFLGQMASRGGRRAPWRLEPKPTMLTRIRAPPPAIMNRRDRRRASDSTGDEEAPADSPISDAGREDGEITEESELKKEDDDDDGNRGDARDSSARFQEYKDAIDEAKDKDVTVIFYTSPAQLGGDGRQLRDLARENKMILQGLRIDYVKNFERQNPPVGLIRGQTNTLLGQYRWLRRNKEAEPGQSGAEDTGDEKGTPTRERRRRQRSLARRLPGRRVRYGQIFTIIGPAMVTIKTALPSVIEKQQQRIAESQSGGAPVGLEGKGAVDADDVAPGKGEIEDVRGGGDAAVVLGEEDEEITTSKLEISAGMVLVGRVDKPVVSAASEAKIALED